MRLLFLPLLFVVLTLLITNSAHAFVELHAHLFMKEGMTFAFNGDFNGPLKAETWSDSLSSQANPESLERSQLRIVVATLYATYPFVLSLRDSIRRQIHLAEAFTRTHPDWIIARKPEDAAKAIKAGKRVLILALEGASGILETEDDLREFVDEKGIRIVTFSHLLDDDLGGVAFLKGWRAIVSPLGFLRSLVDPHHSEGVRANSRGLTDKGRLLLQKLIDRKVWVDLAHASDENQRALIPLLMKAGQSLLYTHTVLRKYHQAERGLADWQLVKIKESGGFVGLMPSEEMLKGTKVDSRFPKECHASVYALASQYNEVAHVIGGSAIALGSDFNGGIPHLSPLPLSCATGTSLDLRDAPGGAMGLANIGQTPDVWKALKRGGAQVPDSQDLILNYFLSRWSRVWGH